MTSYSSQYFQQWETDAFDGDKPTSVHRLQQVFDHSNHLLDSYLQHRVSFAVPFVGWAVNSFLCPYVEGDRRLILTWVVPWRVLSYGTPAPAIARPVILLGGYMSGTNEYVTGLRFSVTMQPATGIPRYGSGYIKRWDAPLMSDLTQTAVIQSTDDISEEKLLEFSPDALRRSVASRDRNDSGTSYGSTVGIVMVRFSAWVKAEFSGGTDWEDAPAYLSHFSAREGAR